jgi:ribosome biogenesis protein NSA2
MWKLCIVLIARFSSPEMAVTVQLPILSVKKNPQNPLYTQLGVLTKGTIIEVNVSELGLVTTNGKVVWGKWAQVTSKSLKESDTIRVLSKADFSYSDTPENDGCVNA